MILFCFLLMSMFPMMKTPLSLGGVLVMLSFIIVSVFSLLAKSWYSYILFLVYIGGLLVLFIYVCMVSSNYPFSGGAALMGVAAGCGLTATALAPSSLPKMVLGQSVFEAGEDLSLVLFIGLVLILLAVFLAVVRIVLGSGSLKVEVGE